ncbi:MAG: antitoxin [Deltaproteobacteria bacterium RIFCSPHIGHO2_12_FULL_43_9]|nr:MAG: antitoxin [Deltaproteobacteria bacterium RIFCSPHIGHO2_12_FULL_43_9]
MKKEYDFSKMKEAEPKYLKHIKSAITMRIDPRVINYFKKLAVKMGLPYQSLINYVLCEYANHRLEPSANWSKDVYQKKL